MRRVLAALVGLAMLPAMAMAGPARAAEPEHQWRGYWVDAAPLRDQDATDSTVLTTILTAALLNTATVAESQSVKHAWIPEVGLESLVTHNTGTIKRYTVQTMSIECKTGGAQVTAEWRKVA